MRVHAGIRLHPSEHNNNMHSFVGIGQNRSMHVNFVIYDLYKMYSCIHRFMFVCAQVIFALQSFALPIDKHRPLHKGEELNYIKFAINPHSSRTE